MRRVQTIQPHISRALGGDGFLSAIPGTASALRNSPRIPSPLDSAFARRGVKDNGRSPSVWSNRTLPVADAGGRQNHRCCLVAWGRLSCRALQTEHFHRAPSLPDCPCSPSVTRSVLFPRPAALDVLLRSPWRTPFGSAFPATNSPRFSERGPGPHCGRNFLPEPPQKDTPSALGAGRLRVASRRSVPRAIRGKSRQEKNHGTL